MIKAIVRAGLNRVVNRDRFNDTMLYRAYFRVFFPTFALARRNERLFYRDALSGACVDTIFDIGANVGSKARIFSDLAKNVICVEPHPVAAERLRQRFYRNTRVRIVEKACGSRPDVAQMHVFGEAHSLNTLSDKWAGSLTHAPRSPDQHGLAAKDSVTVPVTTLDSLIERYGTPYYVKIDVEGFELEVVKGLSTTVPLLSVECNLPTFKQETLAIVDILSSRDPGTTYNFAITEPPATFANEKWLSKDEVISIVRDEKYSFMELFCKASVRTSATANRTS